MKPILYDSAETAFTTNGIGILSDAISCTVKAELNGQYELNLQYPLTGIHVDGIKMRNVIMAPVDPVSDPQPFRIYKIYKPMNNIITVNARHVAYDLAGIVVAPFTAMGAALAMEGLSDNAVTECPFSFSTDKTTQAGFTVKAPTAIWSLLGGVTGSVLDVFGGEYEFDRWNVKLLNRRGMDRGVSIRYGKNLTSLEQDENCANCYTGVMPFWVDRQTGAVITLPNSIVAADGNFGYTKIMPLDMSSEFETAPTDDQLTEAAQNYMKANRIGEPIVGWKVEFVPLEQTEEYKNKALLERILLGDTVSTEFPEMEVSVSARAVITEYNVLLDRYNYVYLGSVRSNIADAIVDQNKEIAARPNKSEMQVAIELLTNSILGAVGGSVRLLDTNGDGGPDTLYIADNPDPALAVKVWRFNYEGWGASENGYNGPFVMGATLTEGFLADFIKSGTLDTRLLKTGVITSADGTVKIDLSNNEISVVGTEGNQISVSAGNILVRDVDGELRIRIGKIAGSGYLLSLQSADHTKVVNFTLFDDGITLGAPNLDDQGGGTSAYYNFGWKCIAGVPVLAGNQTDAASKKLLYSGSVSAGNSFTVNGTAMYDLFAIKLKDTSAVRPPVVLAYKYQNTIYGIGGWCGNSTENKELYFVSCNFDDDTWTLIDAGVHDVYSSGSLETGTKLSLCEVIGIV